MASGNSINWDGAKMTADKTHVEDLSWEANKYQKLHAPYRHLLDVWRGRSCIVFFPPFWNFYVVGWIHWLHIAFCQECMIKLYLWVDYRSCLEDLDKKCPLEWMGTVYLNLPRQPGEIQTLNIIKLLHFWGIWQAGRVCPKHPELILDVDPMKKILCGYCWLITF